MALDRRRRDVDEDPLSLVPEALNSSLLALTTDGLLQVTLRRLLSVHCKETCQGAATYSLLSPAARMTSFRSPGNPDHGGPTDGDVEGNVVVC